MSEEIMKILKMVKRNKISPEEGEKLIAAISVQDSAQDMVPKHKGTMLRIKVDSAEGSKSKTKVNINLPLSIAKKAAGLTKLVPKKAQDELSESGVDLSDLDLVELISMFENGEMEGDLVNIDTSEEDSDEKVNVRIYVD